ncbi:hypothetical protein INT45_006231 [Circinella minor]|uniref:Uncharacterized protein n=1 Tax=Circinella minor TaxID=1195481 RepID=A0A8H7RXE9_9FUNG|nr:hypothetical protein INT45_006231 [Circinella minor]
MTSLQFGEWVERHKRRVYWSQHIITKPTKKDTDKRVRDLYVLEREHHDNVAAFIEKDIPNFQDHIQSLKNSGHVVIGYCRKPDSNETHDARFRSIQLMVYQLIDRCHVQKVFVSPKSNSNQPLMKRDKRLCTHELNELQSVHGSTKDMIKFIKNSTKKVLIVVLGFKGLTTNVNDLKQFLMKVDNVSSIIVDQLPMRYEILLLNRQELIADHNNSINLFESNIQ